MFLKRLREHWYRKCKHSDDSFIVTIQDDGDRILKCQECQKCVSLQYFLCHYLNSWIAPCAAEQYVEWSNDCEISCSFSTFHLRNRAITTEIIAQYATLVKGCMFLEMLHSPFLNLEAGDSYKPTSEGICFWQDTVQAELDRLIEKSSDEIHDVSGKRVGFIAQNILVFLSNLFKIESQRYFNLLVPYVKCVKSRSCSVSDTNLSLDCKLYKRLLESQRFHDAYGRFSIAFDAVHLATLCFLCKDDVNLVCELLFDFAGKFCRGYYFINTFRSFGDFPYDDPVETKITRELMSCKKETRMYEYLQLFRRGGTDLADHFSDSFFKTYWELKSAIVKTETCLIQEHLEWIFPRILFQDYTDYYAFLAALAYYFQETNMGSRTMLEIFADLKSCKAPSGVISKCKSIYCFIKTSLSQVNTLHKFSNEQCLQKKVQKHYDKEDLKLFSIDSNSDDKDDYMFRNKYYWTKYTLSLFLDMNLDIEKELVDSIQWLIKLSLHDKTDPDLQKKEFLEKYIYIKQTDDVHDILHQPGKPLKFKTLCDSYMEKKRILTD